MAPPVSHRDHFFVVGVSDYDNLATLASVDRDRELLSGLLPTCGFTAHAVSLPPQSRPHEVRSTLAAWKRTPAAKAVLFWSGHGGRKGKGYYLLLKESSGRTEEWDSSNAVRASELADFLLTRNVGEILVILDICHAGGAATEILADFWSAADEQVRPPPDTFLLAAVRAPEMVPATSEGGSLVRAIDRVVRQGPRLNPGEKELWTYRDETFSVDDLFRALKLEMGRTLPRQHLDGRGSILSKGFFANPLYNPGAPLETVADARLRRRHAVEAFDVNEARSFFWPRSRGFVETEEAGWSFVGRTRVLRRVVSWLNSGDGLLVITGGAGSGKSAIAGRLATLSDPEYRARAAHEGVIQRAQAGTVPAMESISIAVQLTGKSADACMRRIAASQQVEIPSGPVLTVNGFIERLQADVPPGRMTILMDGLDEAAEPGLIAQLAGKLASRWRVLVGTRPTRGGRRFLQELRAGPANTIDLDTDPDRQEDLRSYARERLSSWPEDIHADAVTRIAAQAEGSFRLVHDWCRLLSSEPGGLAPQSAAFQDLLREGSSGVLALELDRLAERELARYGDMRNRARDLMTGLAWAQGMGMPAGKVWAAVATAVSRLPGGSGTTYDSDDTAWVLEAGGHLLLETSEHGQAVYRLYHQAFVDYLRGPNAEAGVQAVIADALAGLARDSHWTNIDPYIAHHLPAHAAMGGRLTSLVAEGGLFEAVDKRALTRFLGASISISLADLPLLLDALKELPTEVRSHFLVKAKGADPNELSWHFQGREQESTQLARWLKKSRQGMFIVTGHAGCGKSALLGRTVTLANHRLVTALVRAGIMDSPRSDELPPDGVFDVVIHLTGKTMRETIERVANAVSGYGGSPDDIEALLRHLARQKKRFTVLADALDEAADPVGIAESVLRRLAAVDRVRIVVGTRRFLTEDSDQAEGSRQELLEALAVDPKRDHLLHLGDDSSSIVRYVATRLLLTQGSPYAEDHKRARELATRVGGQGQSFLFALLATAELLAGPPLEPHSVAASALLGHDHRRLFATAAERFQTEQPVTAALLRALAFARGRGFPRLQRIWARVTEAIHPHLDITDADIDRALDQAAAYVMVDGDGTEVTYRLTHRALAEHFTVDVDDQVIHRAIYRGLLSLCHQQDWVTASRYLQRHLAGHARLGGCLVDLLEHPDVLDNLDQASLAEHVQHEYFGRDAPAVALQIMQLRTELEDAPPHDRAAIRRLAGLFIGSSSQTSVPRKRWSPRWFSGRRVIPHVTLPTHDARVWSVAFGQLPNGRVLLASASDDGTVRLWDPFTGATVGNPLSGHDSPVKSVTFSGVTGDRVVLASVSFDGTVRRWDPTSGAPIGNPMAPPGTRPRERFQGNELVDQVVLGDPIPQDRELGWSVAFGELPEGAVLLASASAENVVRLWDPHTGKPVGHPLSGHDQVVKSLTFGRSPDGRVVLASASRDGTIQLWDPRGRTPVGSALTGHDGAVTSVAFGQFPDGRFILASASTDGTIRLWDPLEGNAIDDAFAAHDNGVAAIAFGRQPDGRLLLASGGDDGLVRLWDPLTATPVGDPLPGHDSNVTSVAFGQLPNDHVLLASASRDGTIRLWDLLHRRDFADASVKHDKGAFSVAFGRLPDGRIQLASAGDDRTVRLWDANTGNPMGAPLEHDKDVPAVAFGRLPDSQIVLASACYDHTVRLWDPLTGDPIGKPLTGHQTWVLSVAFGQLPDNRVLLASASHDCTLRLWDPATHSAIGEPLAGPPQPPWEPSDPIFSPLYESPWDKDRNWIYTVAFGNSSDGRLLLASGGADHIVRLWTPLDHATPPRSLAGHEERIYSVAFGRLADGDLLLASAGKDRVVRLWDPRSGAPIGAPLAGHEDTVLSVTFGALPDGRVILASASVDRTVLLWDPSTCRAIARIPALAPAWSVAIIHGAHRNSSLLAIATADGVLVSDLFNALST